MVNIKLFKVFLLGGILSAGLVAQYVYPDDFNFVSSPSSGAFLGQVTIDGVPAVDGADIIGAFEPEGGICVGTGTFVAGGNVYGLNIYGNDTTTEEDDGMDPGESFVLVVYDASAQVTIEYGTSFSEWSNENGAVMPAYSNWQAVYDFTSGGEGEWPTYDYPDDFTFVSSPSSGAFLGQVTIEGVPAVDGADIIGAFEPEGGICVGTGTFVAGGNIYGLNIYGNDTTTEEDDGMDPGENFLLVVYDASANITITYPAFFTEWSNENGAVMPAYSNWQEVYNFVPGGAPPTNEPPVADAGEDQTFLVPSPFDPVEVTLDGSGSTDEDGTIETYNWSENNIGIGSGVSVTVSLGVGTHTIMLTVFDDDGATGIDEVTITIIENLAPVAGAGEDQTLEVPYPYNPAEVTLDGSGSSDSDGTIASWTWTWTGGSVSGETATAVFPVGEHAVTLTVTDNLGDTGTDEITITVNEAPNVAPVADAGENQTLEVPYPYDPANVTLDGSGSTDEDGTIETYNWSENNIGIGSGVSATVSLGVGTHTIMLTVFDDDGATGIDEVTITVNEAPNVAPVANAGEDQTLEVPYPYYPAAVTFDGSGSTDEDGTIEAYNWYENSIFIASGVSATVSLGVGTHTIQLTVFDDDGATGTDEVTITVNEAPNVAPVANAGDDQTMYINEGDPDPSITLNGVASSDEDGTIVLYTWSEDGSELASGVSPFAQVSFPPGEHVVTLTVTDDDGATGSDDVIISINVIGQYWIPPDPTAFYHLIYIEDAVLGNTPLQAGIDEIGIFDGDVLVGAAFYTGIPGQAILAWIDNEMTPDSVDGFTPGNSISFRYYDTSLDTEIPIPSGDGYVEGEQVDIEWIESNGWDTSGLFPASTGIAGANLSFNRDPSFTSTPGLQVDEDILYTYAITTFDYDTENYADELTISLTSEPGWLSLSDNGDGSGLLSGTPTNDYVGDNPVVLTITDLSGGTATQSFTITVVNVNDAPVIEGQVELTTPEDTALEIVLGNLTVTDVDNNYPEGFTLTVLPGENYSVESTTITPNLHYNGDLTVPVYVDDGEVLDSQSNTFNLSVTVAPVDDCPVLQGIADQTINIALNEEFASFDLDDFLTEVDGDLYTWSSDDDGAGINVSIDADGVVTFSVDDNWFGTEVITYTVTDITEDACSDSDDATYLVKISYDYSLSENWGWYSFPITPLGEPTPALDFFGPVLDDLFTVKSYDGSLDQVGDSWFDGVGDMSDSEGYVIGMYADATFTIEGQRINPVASLALDVNWNWIGFYGVDGTTADVAFGDITGTAENHNLIVAMAYDGALAWTPWGLLNGIGNMVYAEGYITKVIEAGSLVWGSGSRSQNMVAINIKSMVEPVHFDFARTQSYELINMLWGEADSHLELGNEIAVFCGDVCVGATVYEGNDLMQINAWEDNALTPQIIDGFTLGEDIRFVYWNGEGDVDLNVDFVHDFPGWDDSGTFIHEGLTGVEITTALANDAETLLPSVLALHKNYPNPFNPVTMINYNLPNDALVSMTIYSILGEEVRTLVSGSMIAGYHAIEWNGKDNSQQILPTGVYIYQLVVDGAVVNTRKMVLMK